MAKSKKTGTEVHGSGLGVERSFGPERVFQHGRVKRFDVMGTYYEPDYGIEDEVSDWSERDLPPGGESPGRDRRWPRKHLSRGGGADPHPGMGI